MGKTRTRAQLKTELYKLVVARSDVLSAHKTCRLILDRVHGLGDQLYEPLFHAAVIAYGRPFTDNKTTGPLSRHWGAFADPRLRRMHAKLLQTRHELVAHSDAKVRDVHLLPPGLSVDGIPASSYIGFKIMSYRYGRPMFVDAHDTCSDLIGRLNARLDTLMATLYDGLDLPDREFPLTFDDGL